MACISCGKINRKVKCLFVTVIIYVIVFLLEHYSEEEINFEVRGTSLHLFTYYYSFSFFGSFVGGGICRLIIYLKSYKEKKIKKQLESKKKNRKSLSNELIYNENSIYLFWQYFAFSAFFELIVNTAEICTVAGIIDLDSKILLSGLNVLFIKIFSNKFLNYPIYRHQFITTIILSIFVLFSFFQRYIWVLNKAKEYKKIHSDCSFDNEDCDDTSFTYIERLNISFGYFVFYNFCLLIGFIFNGISICYDKYIIQEKLCNPYKLLFYKGLFGFPVSLTIQIIFRFLTGERRDREEINFQTILKRFSLPIYCLIPKNIIYILVFFISVSFYKIFFIKTIDFYPPEIIGFVLVVSSVFASDYTQIIYLWVNEKYINIIICLVILCFVIFLSLIACEIIILHFLDFDKNINLNIDKRASLEYLSKSVNQNSSQNTSSDCETSQLGIDGL